MPMMTKKLYLATNIEDLQEKANLDSRMITNRPTDNLCKSSQKMLEKAQAMYKENDEEHAFILYFKFIDLVLRIKSRKDFSSNSLCTFLTNAIEPAMVKATELKASLSQRYSSLKLAEEEKELERHSLLRKAENEANKSNAQDEMKNASLIIDTCLDHSITSTKLFSLMKEGECKFLILDVRPAEDFEESHIKHSSCLNVPQEILIPGTTAQKLEDGLPTATLSKWHLKNSVNHVIILDWNTSDTCLPQRHPLHTLEEAMIKWDRKNPLTKQPLILIGGYRDWLLKYPMHTTKAIDVLSMEAPKEMDSITDFSSVEYPDLDGDMVEELGASTVQNNLRVLSRPGSNHTVSGYTGEFNSLPHINRNVKPNSAPVHSSIKLVPKIENSNSNGTKPHTPEFNRELKPAWATKGFNVTATLDEVETIAKDSLTAAQLELSKEQEFAKLRLRKELEAEESIRIELQKQEEVLLDSLKKLHEESKRKDELYLKLKEENEKMKQLLSNQTHMEQTQKEKDIQNLDIKYKNMQKEVDRLRQERKLKEKREAEARAKSHSAGQFRTVNSETIDGAKRSMENDYKKPLKDRSSSVEGSNRLTRSLSSPNIVQLLAEEDKKKIPFIDRSSKPTFDYPAINPNEFKIRNLNPTYASSGTLTGLRNLGNTCYMNSIIQCLSNTMCLLDYFRNRQYENHIKKNSKQGTNGEIVHEFALIVWSLWTGKYKSISPKDFKDVASKYIPMCKGYEQQDAHEFLVVLMDKLHGDLNQGRDIGPLPNLESLSEIDATEKFWNHHKTKNVSKISSAFEGYLKSTLTCLSCRKTSNSFEVFSCLSLPISSNRCTLEDCLQTFLKPERMVGEAAWDCPVCRQKKEAEKSLTFCKLPDVLIIQLKRFSYEGMWRRKIQSVVDFVERLEMKADRYYSYNLYGIVNHFGYLEGGHYTAYCKRPKTNDWYKFDDHEVSKITSSDIMTSAAYLLFYYKT